MVREFDVVVVGALIVPLNRCVNSTGSAPLACVMVPISQSRSEPAASSDDALQRSGLTK